jgi:hypothetical protein
MFKLPQKYVNPASGKLTVIDIGERGCSVAAAASYCYQSQGVKQVECAGKSATHVRSKETTGQTNGDELCAKYEREGQID